MILLVAAMAWWLRPHSDRSAPQASLARPTTVASTPAPSGPCARPATRPFVPTSLSIPGVMTRRAVRPVPRTSDGIMGVLAETDKTELATDLHGVRAGAAHGRLLLNTHTWPDGSALGNLLLAKLRVGGHLVVRGHGETQCYRVVSRQQVLASMGYPGWDRRIGPPQAIIVVCSGKRLGPEDWTHRTLWFADPYLGGSPDA